jgi:hypothetical protein
MNPYSEITKERRIVDELSKLYKNSPEADMKFQIYVMNKLAKDPAVKEHNQRLLIPVWKKMATYYA